MKIRLGTRSSRLAVAQAKLVKELIVSTLNWEVEIITSDSIGDKDMKSRLTRFRGQGVFTSTLEMLLLDKKIDIAVHSLKDLPVEDNEGLQTIGFVKRHQPSDSIIIKNEMIIAEDPLQFRPGMRFATGSPRRQSQMMAYDHQSLPVEIRGNVETRLSRLTTGYVDAVIMASAVFDRIDLKLPENTSRYELPMNRFPSSPGQAIIAIQTRDGEFKELEQISDQESYQAATLERQILLKAGGGCELSLGLNVQRQGGTWLARGSLAETNWKPSTVPDLRYLSIEEEDLDTLKHQLLQWITEDLGTDRLPLAGMKVGITRSEADSESYNTLLQRYGAELYHSQIYQYYTSYDLVENTELVDAWKQAEWLIISSKRTKEFLRLMYAYFEKSFRVGVTGPATASMMRELDLPVHLISEDGMSGLQQLLAEARDIHPGKVIYLHGSSYHDLPCDDAQHFSVYQSQDLQFQIPPELDYLVVFSRRTAEKIISTYGKNCTKVWVAIGKTTGQWLKDQDVAVKIAPYPTPEGILTAMTTN